MLNKREISVERVQKFAESGYLFAVLDAVESPAVIEKAVEVGEARAIALSPKGSVAEASEIRPYLFAVDPTLLDWIANTLDKASWGVFALTKTTLEKLRPHFERFLVAQLPDGEEWFFRYYDPRILQVYLSHCNEFELHRMFGQVRGFVIPDFDEKKLMLFEHSSWASPDERPTDPSFTLICQIRPEQYQAFEKAAQTDFLKRAVDFLTTNFPQETGAVSPEELVRRIQAGTVRARSYGITQRPALIAFIAAMFELAPNFDAYPRFRSIFEDQAIPGNSKMNRIFSTATEKDLIDIREQADSSQWYESNTAPTAEIETPQEKH